MAYVQGPGDRGFVTRAGSAEQAQEAWWAATVHVLYMRDHVPGRVDRVAGAPGLPDRFKL